MSLAISEADMSLAISEVDTLLLKYPTLRELIDEGGNSAYEAKLELTVMLAEAEKETLRNEINKLIKFLTSTDNLPRPNYPEYRIE